MRTHRRRLGLLLLLSLAALPALAEAQWWNLWFKGRPKRPVAVATTLFYVDPDFGGAHTGAAATPWVSLSDSGAWTDINAALATTHVTVYFSARAASSDVDETTTTGITISRTDGSTHRLTLDGMTYYNSNDGSPSWVLYPSRTQSVTLADERVISGKVFGGSRFFITAGNPVMTTQAANNYVTVKGFKTLPTSNQCLWYWLGDGVVVEDLVCYADSISGVGPGIYFVGQREEIAVSGNGGACVPMSYQNCDGFEDLTVRRNHVKRTRGEGIYFGGVGDQTSPGVSSKIQNYLIEDNVLEDPAYYGNEGDAIDIKTMITGVVVRGNVVVFSTAGTGTPRACLETLSGVVLDSNFCDGGALARLGFSLTDFWGGVASNRPASVVRNNIIVNLEDNVRGAVYCWGDTSGADDFTGLLIDNNTIHGGTHGVYLGADCSGATLRNNLVAEATTLALFSSGAITTHSNNLLYRASGNLATVNGSTYTAANLTSYEASALTADPLLVSTSSPRLPVNFKIQTGSPAKNAGATVGTFALDYFGVGRPVGVAWDIGAAEVP